MDTLVCIKKLGLKYSSFFTFYSLILDTLYTNLIKARILNHAFLIQIAFGYSSFFIHASFGTHTIYTPCYVLILQLQLKLCVRNCKRIYVLSQQHLRENYVCWRQRRPWVVTSNTNVGHQKQWWSVWRDTCVSACRVERNFVGISSDALLEPQFTARLCSPSCYQNFPNIVDL